MSDPRLAKGVILNDVTPSEVNATEAEEEETCEDVVAENCEVAVAAGFLNNKIRCKIIEVLKNF